MTPVRTMRPARRLPLCDAGGRRTAVSGLVYSTNRSQGCTSASVTDAETGASMRGSPSTPPSGRPACVHDTADTRRTSADAAIPRASSDPAQPVAPARQTVIIAASYTSRSQAPTAIKSVVARSANPAALLAGLGPPSRFRSSPLIPHFLTGSPRPAGRGRTTLVVHSPIVRATSASSPVYMWSALSIMAVSTRLGPLA